MCPGQLKIFSPKKLSTRSKIKFPVILLFGPTGVGKTDLIFSLFKDSFEIINADSMQVYQGLDIGSAKPSPSFRSLIPHHLFDIRTPDCQFNAGDFVTLADKHVKETASRGNIPVISGGTAFYFRNYLFGLPESPRVNAEVRKDLQRDLHQKGLALLYEELKRTDPLRAGQINSRDSYRILRALEVFRSTGISLSSYTVPAAVRSDIQPLVIGLQRDRKELYTRINKRVDIMFRDGLVEEVKHLIAEGYSQADPGMRGIGYKEFFLQRRTGELTRTGVSALIKQNSRRYAKRQMTFFKKMPGVLWFHPDERKKIKEVVERFLIHT